MEQINGATLKAGLRDSSCR